MKTIILLGRDRQSLQKNLDEAISNIEANGGTVTDIRFTGVGGITQSPELYALVMFK